MQPRKTNGRWWLEQKINKAASERKLRRVGATHPLHSQRREPARSTPSATSHFGARAWSELNSTQWLHLTQPRVAHAMEQRRGRQLHQEKHEAVGIDENVMLHAVPRIEASACQLRLGWRWRAQQQLHSWRLGRRRVVSSGDEILRTRSRTWNVQRKSAVRNAGIYCARGALRSQRVACAERGAKRWISILFKTVCRSSTTSTRRRYELIASGVACAVGSAVPDSVGQPQGVCQLRVAGHAAAPGKVGSLARRCPNVDGMHCLRGLRSSCRCSALWPWVKEVAATVASGKERERRKDEGSVQHMRPTLPAPEHEGNMQKQTRSTRLSFDRPPCRWRAGRFRGALTTDRPTNTRRAAGVQSLLENRVDGPSDGWRIVPVGLRCAQSPLGLEGAGECRRAAAAANTRRATRSHRRRRTGGPQQRRRGDTYKAAPTRAGGGRVCSRATACRSRSGGKSRPARKSAAAAEGRRTCAALQRATGASCEHSYVGTPLVCLSGLPPYPPIPPPLHPLKASPA